MNKDFHYGAIKVLTRAAGFPDDEAELIAFASQYVDDCTYHEKMESVENLLDNAGESLPDKALQDWVARTKKALGNVGKPDWREDRPLVSKNEFDPICTAHSCMEEKIRGMVSGLRVWELFTYGKRILDKDTQAKVYISFHFLPPDMHPAGGNGAYNYCVVPNCSFGLKWINAIRTLYKRPGEQGGLDSLPLIALGIALHTFADTWAHQYFSGRHNSKDNDLGKVQTSEDDFHRNHVIDILVDYGHLEALGLPDASHQHLKIEFAEKRRGKKVSYDRRNYLHFVSAAKTIYEILCSFRAGAPGNKTTPWTDLENPLYVTLKHPVDPDTRLRLMEHEFGPLFTPPLSLQYLKDRWQSQAMAIRWNGAAAPSGAVMKYTPDSLWFQFQIAAAAQRGFVMNHIKPL